MFILDSKLQEDTVHVGDLTLCQVLLMNDVNYPWLILVPKCRNITEVYQLSDSEQLQLMQEISYTAKQMETHFLAEKINVAALGNVVPQLHVHIVARFRSDPAWPAPVWGKVKSRVYDSEDLEATLNSVRALLSERLHIPLDV